MEIEGLKNDFPIFETNLGLVYLDNAATTHKPHVVLEALVDFYTHLNANVHRGIYPLSEAATDAYELARRKVAGFIGAESPAEIVFTGGTTDSLNLLASMLSASDITQQNPIIVTTEAEHHSNILPWQQITDRLHYLKLDEEYTPTFEDEKLLAEADIVTLSLASNVTGAITDIKTLRKLTDAIIVVDAAQAIAHLPINVSELGADFVAFGGHKMYGPMGIGVLYGRKHLLEKLQPAKLGGGMINKVERKQSSWAPIPERFEAGTPSVADAVGLAAAIDFILAVGWEQIERHESHLANLLSEGLSEITELKLFHAKNGIGVFSFTVDGIHPHDLAQELGEAKICIRAGHHCTQILHREVLQIPASARASIGIYNSESDVDKLIQGITSAIEKFKR